MLWTCSSRESFVGGWSANRRLPSASIPSSNLAGHLAVNSAIPAGIPFHLSPSPGSEPR
jgi:hypothetical protein